jgi:phosphate transport system substrate-binding protein
MEWAIASRDEPAGIERLVEDLEGMILRGNGIAKRLGLLISLMMVASLILAACGGDDDDDATSTSGAGAATTTSGSGSTTATTGTGSTTATTGSATTPSAAAGTTASTGTGSTPTTAPAWAPRNAKADLTGSGSSFIDPAMQAWIAAYKDVAGDTSTNYQSVGSGQGKKDFISGVTDFGATDAFMTDDELTQDPGALHVPMVMGAVVLTYNLEGVDTLQFSGETIANIFLGTITTWNDPAIAADNPGVTLPDTPITVVHRSDGSGTTAIFTDYLSKISDDWKNDVGSGTTVEWPVGIGGEKSAGVTAGVQQTPGAIGYVELIYALSNNLPAPAVKNSAGNFVVPGIESTSAAAAGMTDIPADLRVSITNPAGADAYPIAGFTWVLVNSEMKDEGKAQALTDFLYWSLTQGNDTLTSLNYAPLPDDMREMAIAQLEKVMVNGSPAFTAP